MVMRVGGRFELSLTINASETIIIVSELFTLIDTQTPSHDCQDRAMANYIRCFGSPGIGTRI